MRVAVLETNAWPISGAAPWAYAAVKGIAVTLPTFLAASFYVFVDDERGLRDFGDAGRPPDIGLAPARTCSDG